MGSEGAGLLLRRRHRENVRAIGHRTRADHAHVLRAAALSMLNAPYCNDEMRDSANGLLELVGDTLTLPRHGWYPRAPKEWKP